MPDYSEFPTTPTAWQEAQWEDLRPVEPAPAPEQRRPDLVALVPGVIFTVVAIVLMTGVNLPAALFSRGGPLWILLIGAGVLILVGEVRKLRRR